MNYAFFEYRISLFIVKKIYIQIFNIIILYKINFFSKKKKIEL